MTDLLLVREIDPAQWLPRSVSYRAFAHGAFNDLQHHLLRNTARNSNREMA